MPKKQAKEWKKCPFFAVGPGCFGRGDTAEEAIKNAKRAGGLRAGTHEFWIYGPCVPEHEIGITQMGYIEWRTHDDTGKELPKVQKEERKVRVR